MFEEILMRVKGVSDKRRFVEEKRDGIGDEIEIFGDDIIEVRVKPGVQMSSFAELINYVFSDLRGDLLDLRVYPEPKYKRPELREPTFGAIIKPSYGFDMSYYKRVVRRLAEEGLSIIKEDELFTGDRISRLTVALDILDDFDPKPLYVVNAVPATEDLLDELKEHGAEAVLITFLSLGLDAINRASKRFFVRSHRAGHQFMNVPYRILAYLQSIAGANFVHVGTDVKEIKNMRILPHTYPVICSGLDHDSLIRIAKALNRGVYMFSYSIYSGGDVINIREIIEEEFKNARR